jgi:hypothetical protein
MHGGGRLQAQAAAFAPFGLQLLHQRLRFLMLAGQLQLHGLDLGQALAQALHHQLVRQLGGAVRGQLAQRLQREAQALRQLDRQQALQRRVVVDAVAIGAALGRWQQAAGFIEADGRGRHAAAGREFADLHALFRVDIQVGLKLSIRPPEQDWREPFWETPYA